MADLPPGVTAALASLRTRWGAAVIGSLAAVPEVGAEDGEDPAGGHAPAVDVPGGWTKPASNPGRQVDEDRVLATGFAALDAILGPGGVPRSTVLALRGDASSGKTTVALRLAAQAQAAGSIVAWLDLGRSLDPVEAVSRGVDLEWLVVLEPGSLDEALAMAGELVAGRTVDFLLVDLPVTPPLAPPPDSAPPSARNGVGRDRRAPSVMDRLGRLAALARRAGVLLVFLEPPGLASAVSGAVAESAGLRLELARRSWIRLGRDVVGQRTEVVVARNRHGPPGKRAELRILYAEGGVRDACLARPSLLADAHATPQQRTLDHATPSSPLAAPLPPAHADPRDGEPGLRILPDRAAHPRRPAMDGWSRPRREPGSPRPRGPARDVARSRSPAGS